MRGIRYVVHDLWTTHFPERLSTARPPAVPGAYLPCIPLQGALRPNRPARPPLNRMLRNCRPCELPDRGRVVRPGPPIYRCGCTAGYRIRTDEGARRSRHGERASISATTCGGRTASRARGDLPRRDSGHLATAGGESSFPRRQQRRGPAAEAGTDHWDWPRPGRRSPILSVLIAARIRPLVIRNVAGFLPHDLHVPGGRSGPGAGETLDIPVPDAEERFLGVPGKRGAGGLPRRTRPRNARPASLGGMKRADPASPSDRRSRTNSVIDW